ncbi:MAG: hypothetical protein KA004_03645 [Verrucomicrobiales bacterium]|nr:hypothetical protein [Verrucomicrobiales bacterium]
MKTLLLFFALGLFIDTAAATVKTLEFHGTLLQHESPDSRFAEGADFILSLELDDSVPGQPFGTPGDAYSGTRYPNAIRQVTLTLPEQGISIRRSQAADHEILFYGRQALSQAAITVDLRFTDPHTSLFDGFRISWYPKRNSPPLVHSLTQDLTALEPFLLVDVAYYTVAPELPSLALIRCFGWAREAGIVGHDGTPAIASAERFDHLLVFGDSLSDAKRHGTNPADNFDGASTNGPLWPEYFCWLTGIRYEERWDFSRFGGFVGPGHGLLGDIDLSHSLGVYWSQSTIFAGLFFLGLLPDPSPIIDSLRLTGQDEVLRGMALVDDIGLRNVLLLAPADITIAPLVRTVLAAAPEQLALLSQLMRSSYGDYQHYLEHWVGGLFPALKITAIDVNSHIDEFMTHPQDYGITNVTGFHTDMPGPERLPLSDFFGNPGSSYFFWTNKDPTTKVHAYLAQILHDAVYSATPVAEKPFSLRCIHRKDGSAWLFGIHPPQGKALHLEASESLNFPGTVLKSFSTTDPLLFFVAPATEPRKFYRLRE